MPHPCAVCGRSRMNPNNRVEEYIFFGFPVNDEARCKKWLEFCCREELYKLSKKQLLQRMVCSKHFLLSDFVNEFYDRLNSTAVPSIYDPKQSLYNISCVLCGRFRKDAPNEENDNTTFHHFPGEEFRCLKWLDFVGVESYYRLTRKEIMFCYICSKHFDRSQFMPGFHNRLDDTAVPNIKNPDEFETDDDEKPSHVLGIINVELFNSCNKNEKIDDPLPTAVLESQACAACGRLRNDPNNKTQKYKFHPFPAYEIGRCLKWCEFLGREDILKLSPNQIRRLVLCSGHFQAGQNFNNGSGPCDAVPTIWKCSNVNKIITEADPETEGETNKIVRASVSSKKPKMDPQNKPTPLAKKRGKSKRPTLINIPKTNPKIENYSIRKLPIPAANNWKLITNQLQPITITNNIVSNVSSDIKKVILPFSGDISNLGAPIPVDSLSSMPPGLLIKIDLPEQNKNITKSGKRKSKRKTTEQEQVNKTKKAKIQNNIKNNIVTKVPVQFINFPKVPSEQVINNLKTEIVDEDTNEDTAEIVSEEYYEETEQKTSETIVEEIQPKVKMSAKCRRTLRPIQRELRRFINKLKPQVSRLPRRSKAQVKLAIVNMVIDRL